MQRNINMPSQFSRRSLLRLGGAALAASVLSGSRLRVYAQGQSSLVAHLRSITIPTTTELLTSLVNFWGNKHNTPVKLSQLSRQQLTQAMVSAAKAGKGPDIIESTYLLAYAHADMLVDISDMCAQVGHANGGWYDFAREQSMVDGVWRAMPHFFAPIAMVYRKDFFQHAGIAVLPKTWDDMLTAGTKLKAMGKPMGFTFGHALGDGPSFVFSLFWAFGGSVTDADGHITLDAAETKRALQFGQQFYHDALRDTSLTYDDPDNNTEFLTEHISCTMNPTSILWQAQNDKVAFLEQIDHFPMPAGPAGTPLLLEAHTLGISKFSKHIEKAKEFISYLNAPEVWTPLLPTAFAFEAPLLKSYDDRPEMPWNSNPKLTVFKGQAKLGQALHYPGKPSAKLSPLATNFIMTDMFARVCSGKATVDASITQAVQAVQEMYQAS